MTRGLRALWSYALLWYGLGILALGSFVWGLVALPLLLLPRGDPVAIARRARHPGSKSGLGHATVGF